MNLENVSREDWIVGGLALLLAIFLLILPWFDFSVGPYSATSAATGAPDGWLGILAFIACLALVADIAVERLSPQTQLPAVGSRPHTRFIIAAVAAAFVVLKFLFHIHFSLFGWGFYVDILVTAALVYFALQVRNGAPVNLGKSGGPGSGPGGSTAVAGSSASAGTGTAGAVPPAGGGAPAGGPMPPTGGSPPPESPAGGSAPPPGI